MHALIDNNSIVRITNNLRKEFPNTSFPKDLPDEYDGWVKVVDNGSNPSEDKQLSSSFVDLVDGVPTVIYVYEDIPDDVLLDHLMSYAEDFSKSALEYNGFIEDFTKDQRYEVKQTIDFMRELGENAPTSITWQGTYGSQDVTLETLIGWIMAGGMRRYKRFQIISTFDVSGYTTKKKVEAAFNEVMQS